LHRSRRVTRLRSAPTGGSPTKRARRRPGAAPRGMASAAGGPSPPRPGPMPRSGSDSRMASSPGSPSASRPPAGAGIASSRSRTERSPLPSSLSHNARMACGAAVVTRASVIVAMTTRSNLARAYAARPVSQTRHIRCARRRRTARGAPPTRADATGRSGANKVEPWVGPPQPGNHLPLHRQPRLGQIERPAPRRSVVPSSSGPPP